MSKPLTRFAKIQAVIGLPLIGVAIAHGMAGPARGWNSAHVVGLVVGLLVALWLVRSPKGGWLFRVD